MSKLVNSPFAASTTNKSPINIIIHTTSVPCRNILAPLATECRGFLIAHGASSTSTTRLSAKNKFGGRRLTSHSHGRQCRHQAVINNCSPEGEFFSRLRFYVLLSIVSAKWRHVCRNLLFGEKLNYLQ